MNNFTIKNNLSVCQALEWLCLLCAFILLIIWPLPHTIALRNSCLWLGALSSVSWIIFFGPKWKTGNYLPTLFLLAIPIWLILHLLFFPVDPPKQLAELKGTWLRVALAIVMASGLGQMIALRPQRSCWLWIGLTIVPILTFISYLNHGLTYEQWFFEFRGLYTTKIAAVYFVMWPCLWAYAVLHYQFSVGQTQGFRRLSYISLALGVVLVCLTDFVAVRGLNGVLVSGLMGGLLALILSFHFVTSSRQGVALKSVIWISVIGLITLLCFVFWQYDQRYEKKLGHLYGDIQISAQIDQHTAWRRESSYQGPYVPSDTTGRPINVSTYERTAWFISGLQMLLDYPLGAGITPFAYQKFLTQQFPDSTVTKSHSGWLDFALGVGLPGLILAWFAIGLTINKAIQSIRGGADREPSYITFWMLLGMIFLWFPGEVAEREYFEHFFFMIVYLGLWHTSIKRNK